MKALREAALWLAVYGSVAGVGWSLHAWEATGRDATTALQILGQQQTLQCATGVDASAGSSVVASCDALRASPEPALINAGQVGLD